MIRRSFPFSSRLNFLLALLLCFLFISSDSAKHTFRYRLTKGTTYRYAVSHDWRNSSVSGGKTTLATISGTAWISLTVDSVRKEGEFVCTGKVDSANLSFGSVFGKDTSGVQKYFGKRVRMVMSPTGKTLAIVPIDSVPPEKATRAYDQFGPLQLLPTVFVRLPDRPLGIGDTWELPLGHTGKFDSISSSIQGTTTYRLEGTERIGSHECVKLALEAKATGQTSGMAGRATKSGSEWSSKAGGFVHFDTREGIMISVDITTQTKAASTSRQLPWSTEGTLTRRARFLE